MPSVSAGGDPSSAAPPVSPPGHDDATEISSRMLEHRMDRVDTSMALLSEAVLSLQKRVDLACLVGTQVRSLLRDATLDNQVAATPAGARVEHFRRREGSLAHHRNTSGFMTGHLSHVSRASNLGVLPPAVGERRNVSRPRPMDERSVGSRASTDHEEGWRKSAGLPSPKRKDRERLTSSPVPVSPPDEGAVRSFEQEDSVTSIQMLSNSNNDAPQKPRTNPLSPSRARLQPSHSKASVQLVSAAGTPPRRALVQIPTEPLTPAAGHSPPPSPAGATPPAPDHAARQLSAATGGTASKEVARSSLATAGTGPGPQSIAASLPPPAASSRRGTQELWLQVGERTGRGVLMPDDAYRRILHAVLVLAILLDAVDVGLSLIRKGWHHPDHDLTAAFPYCWGAIECVLFGAEILMNTRTALLRDWELIDSDPKQILNWYKSTWLAFDVVAWLPVDVVLYAAEGGTGWRALRVLKLMRVIRLPFLFPKASPIEEVPKWIEALLFFAYCALGVHIMTIIWLVIATPEELVGPLPEPDPIDEVTYGVYYIITTLSSVGYGDLSPTRVGTMWYCIFVQLTGVGWLIYVGAVGTAFILEEDPYKVSMKDRKRRLAAMMKNNNIPWQLQKQCFTILPSILESSIKDYNVILSELPPFMQDQLQDCLKAQLVHQVPLFRGASPEVMRALVKSLRSAIIPPREYVIEMGEIGEEMFFISHGCVEITVPDKETGKEKWVATLKDGSWFGEVALLCSTERTANVRAISACDVFVLHKDAFLSIVESSPEFGQKIRAEYERRMNAGKGVTPGGGKRGSDERPQDTAASEETPEEGFGAKQYSGSGASGLSTAVRVHPAMPRDSSVASFAPSRASLLLPARSPSGSSDRLEGPEGRKSFARLFHRFSKRSVRSTDDPAVLQTGTVNVDNDTEHDPAPVRHRLSVFFDVDQSVNTAADSDNRSQQ